MPGPFCLSAKVLHHTARSPRLQIKAFMVDQWERGFQKRLPNHHVSVSISIKQGPVVQIDPGTEGDGL